MREAYIDGMRRFLDFKGRTSRRSYWLFQLTVVLVHVWVALIDAVLGTDNVLFLAAQIAHFVPITAAQVRRIRDAGHSPWWWLAIFTGVGVLLVLYFLCKPSNRALEGRVMTPEVHPTEQCASRAEPSRTATAELEALARMHDKGQLSDSEFASMKADLLAQREPVA